MYYEDELEEEKALGFLRKYEDDEHIIDDLYVVNSFYEYWKEGCHYLVEDLHGWYLDDEPNDHYVCTLFYSFHSLYFYLNEELGF